jgi:hypothetical protein
LVGLRVWSTQVDVVAKVSQDGAAGGAGGEGAGADAGARADVKNVTLVIEALVGAKVVSRAEVANAAASSGYTGFVHCMLGPGRRTLGSLVSVPVCRVAGTGRSARLVGWNAAHARLVKPAWHGCNAILQPRKT